MPATPVPPVEAHRITHSSSRGFTPYISEMQARSKRALDAMVIYEQTRQACQVNNYNLYSTLHNFTPFDSI
jgi:hypothetical protein